MFQGEAGARGPPGPSGSPVSDTDHMLFIYFDLNYYLFWISQYFCFLPKGQSGPQGPPGDVGDPGQMVKQIHSLHYVTSPINLMWFSMWARHDGMCSEVLFTEGWLCVSGFSWSEGTGGPSRETRRRCKSLKQIWNRLNVSQWSDYMI